MPADPSPRAYRSIFLSERWAHQRYFGWAVEYVTSGLTVLSRRHGPARRTLFLLTADGQGALDRVISRAPKQWGLHDLVVHDFDRVFDSSRISIGGYRFGHMQAGTRLLNVATFVIDLDRSEEAILADMTSDYRRKIRKAEAAGVSVAAHDCPENATQAAFVAAFAAFARPRGLHPIKPATVRAMYARGDAILFVAERNRVVTNYLHVYKAGDAGLFMYGVNIAKENDGAGQYLHWQAMLRLRAEGFGWYDLGGVAQDRGIRTFKERFGGQYVDLGIEWRASGLLARALTGLRRGLSRAGVGA